MVEMMSDYAEQLNSLRRQYRSDNNLDPTNAVVASNAGVIRDTSIPGNVFVRIQTSNGLSSIRSVGGPVTNMTLYPGLNVKLEKDERGQLFIAKTNTQAQFAAGANPYITSQPPQQRVTQSLIETLAVVPTNPPSLMVSVKAWNPIVNGTYYEFPGTLVDFTGSLPATGSMYYGSIFLKNDYTTGEVKFSTQRPLYDLPLGISDVQETVNARSTNAIPDYAIKLIGGQTQITLTNILNDGKDLRQLVNIEGATGGGTVTSVTASAPLASSGGATPNISVTGTLNAANGGTGIASPTTHDLLIANGSSAMNLLAPGTTRNVAISDGTDWTSRALIDADVPNALTISGGTVDNTPVGASVASTGLFTSLAADSVAIKAYNGSGATANANEVGYLDYDVTNGYIYKTTTTANLDGVAWCVVVNGGGNGANIDVARHGQVTVKLNANCSINNFLLTSTTAGQASVSTTMRPEIFAVALSANAGGAGGTCTAMLLTETRLIAASDPNRIYLNNGENNTDFVSTISGVPSATSVTYGAVTSGNENCIAPGTASMLGQLRLYNSTRGTYRLITAVNTGTNVITTVSSSDSWASGDTITAASQTVTTGLTQKAFEIDLTQQTSIPLLARAILMLMYTADTGAVGKFSFAHPYEAYAVDKQRTSYNQSTAIGLYGEIAVPLFNQKFTYAAEASGTGTSSTAFFLQGYMLAVP